MAQYFSITGAVYMPVSLAFLFIAYRYFQIFKEDRTRTGRDLFLYFVMLTLICLTGGLAGTVFLDNPLGIKVMLMVSAVFLTVANALLGHLLFVIKYPERPAWWGFGVVFIYGSFVTILTAIGPMHPRLESSGGVDWGLPAYIDYLRASVYLIATIPVTRIYIEKYKQSADRFEKSENLFLVMVFFFAMLVVVADFIVEPLLKTKALLSEEILLFFGVVGMFLYIWLNEKSLKQSEERLKLAVRGARIGLWDWKIEENELVVNERWAKIAGYTREELMPITIDTWVRLMHPDDLESSRKQLKEHFVGDRDFYEMESRIRHRNGSWVWVQDRGRVLARDTEGRALRIAGTRLEITRRKQTEARLLMSLQEKENLLKEVYHRTKNNMMVIISLLNLQQQELDRREIKDVLKQVANRIFSMSMVHQQLYQSKNIATIQLDIYIRELVNHLRVSLLKHPDRVAINCQCEPIQLGLHEAVTLGLVLNEILTNSFKHAFPGGRSGNVTLSIAQSEKQLIQIDIEDDGIGLPDDEPSSAVQTMGRKLIQMLVEDQLFGKLAVESGQGVHYHLSFSVDTQEEEAERSQSD